ncbi:MAG TPA: ABC transporter permease, partial [Gemmatimonadaceae bacterium]|nr:ABC transporter permease [Gemmatimonadaceae bacterium]
MARFPGLRRFMRVERDGAGVARAVDEELRFHFDMAMRDLMSSGLSADEARREAERRFGDVQRTRERLADIDRARVGQERRAERWSAFAQDLRYALRGIRRTPGFAAAVVLTLGLGIGANAAMFRIVDQLLFRPPAYLAAPARTGRVYFQETFRGKRSANSYTGYRRYLDVRANTHAFDAITPYTVNQLAVGEGTQTKELKFGITGADFWKMFDAKPVLGRFFTAAEDMPPKGSRVVVLSYGFWQTEFGGRNPIGQRIDIGPARYTVIGVMPPRFNGFGDDPVAGFLPMSAQMGASGNGDTDWYDTYNMTWFEIFARRKPAVTAAAANADLARAQQLSYRRMASTGKGWQPITIAQP